MILFEMICFLSIARWKPEPRESRRRFPVPFLPRRRRTALSFQLKLNIWQICQKFSFKISLQNFKSFEKGKFSWIPSNFLPVRIKNDLCINHLSYVSFPYRYCIVLHNWQNVMNASYTEAEQKYVLTIDSQNLSELQIFSSFRFNRTHRSRLGGLH